MTAKLHYSRYGCPYTDEFETARDAARLAIYQEEYGEMYAVKIEDDSGTVWERTSVPWADNDDSDRLRALAGYAPDSET